jgi:hypothetical protein
VSRLTPNQADAQAAARQRAAAAEAARQRAAADRQREAARAATASQAAARAEAARQTKAQVERAERAAEAAAAARAEAARQTKAQVERAERAAEAASQQRSNQGRRPDDWNSTIHNNRNKQTQAAPTSGTASPAPANTTGTGNKGAANPTVNPEPSVISIPDPPKFNAIKAAPIDTVAFVDETFSSEFITDLLFEDVGGQELLSIARDDTVNGQEVVYQPFKNLGILRDTYDINNLLKLQETSDKFFANFTINLLDKIPEVGNGPNGKNYYLTGLGDGIIEFVNMRDDEQVEVQISNTGIIEEVGI